MKFGLPITVLGFLWATAPFVFAQNVSLEVQPSSITSSSSGSTAKVRVVLKNPTADTLSKISLDPFSNDGIQVTAEKPSATSVAAKSEIVWPVNVSIPENSRLPGSVTLEAKYTAANHDHHVFASLSLASDGEKKIVEASLEGNLDAVSKQRPSIVYVLVINNLDVPVDTRIESKAEDCEFKDGKENCSAWANITVFCDKGLRILAHSNASCKIKVAGAARVTPGARPLLVDVNAKWDRAGRAEQRQFALTKTATVGVFFESEILKALGVPSFLLLPGCLIIFTMQLLLTFGVLGLKDASKLPSLTVTSPSFWILSITLSGLFAPLYFCLTGVNYLLHYGAEDLGIVWLSSIGIGVIIYLVIAGFTLSYRRAHLPSTKDKPLATLLKLGNNGLKIERPRVKYKLGDTELTGFMIEGDIQDGQTLVWVAPHIKITWREPDSEPVKAWRKEVNEITNLSRDPEKLATVLKNAKEAAQLEFEAAGTVPNPYHLKVDAITQYLAAELIIG